MKIVVLCAIAIGMMSVALACGGDSGSSSASGGESASKVVQADGVYTLGDFLDIGFKKGKTFDIEGLPEATDAFYGFWGLDPYDRKEFELRLYASHEAAVEFGTFHAEERVGRDAKLKKDEATWKEGLTEARACTRGGQGYVDSSNCSISRYGDYVFYGNAVLICQGSDASDARKNCNALLAEFQ